MKKIGTTFQILLFSIGCYCQICISTTQLHGDVGEEELHKLNLSALIHTYEWSEDSPTYFLYKEHHTIHFQGIEGGTSITFGIRNFVAEFEPGISDEQPPFHPSHEQSTLGIGFYFWNPPSRIYKSGVEPMESSEGFLRFAHSFYPNAYRSNHYGINYNMYSRDPLSPPTGNPIKIKWMIEKKDIIEDPDIQSFDINGNRTDLKGNYALWNIQMQIDDSLINVANFYLLEDLASQLDSETPLELGQSFSNDWVYNAVRFHKSNIEYTEISVENESGSYCITDWEIVDHNTCLTNEQGQVQEDLNIYDSSFGWIKQNNHLTSIAGEFENLKPYQQVGDTFNNLSYSENCEGSEAVTSVLDTRMLNIKVYPNPSSDYIFFDTPDETIYTTTLFSQDGREIITSTTDLSLDIKELALGIYLIEIKDIKSGERTIQKILKY